MEPLPVCFIVDDGGPVNLYHFHDLWQPHERFVPAAFAREFAKICQRNHVMGKFSFVPMPAGMGRIDGRINGLPAKELKEYIKIVRELQGPFSITPEILTHYRAYNLQNPASCQHVMEDVYFATASAEEIRDYVSLALEVLCNVGLTPTGVTSPWCTGKTNEENYAKGIGMAFKKVMDAEKCFYFLHSREPNYKVPLVAVHTPETGKVVSVPNNAIDAFWPSQIPLKVGEARKSVKEKMDSLLSPDGKSGKLRQLFEERVPLVFISHWQSLFSDGRCIGLEGFDVLTKRINKVFGKEVEWMPMAELAERWTK